MPIKKEKGRDSTPKALGNWRPPQTHSPNTPSLTEAELGGVRAAHRGPGSTFLPGPPRSLSPPVPRHSHSGFLPLWPPVSRLPKRYSLKTAENRAGVALLGAENPLGILGRITVFSTPRLALAGLRSALGPRTTRSPTQGLFQRFLLVSGHQESLRTKPCPPGKCSSRTLKAVLPGVREFSILVLVEKMKVKTKDCGRWSRDIF